MTMSSVSLDTADVTALSRASLDEAIGRGVGGLLGLQREDGHWAFILEADATIPAEYILLKHFLGVVDREKEAKLADYIRSIQSTEHGGWPLWHDGPFNISASVKAYFALKAAGDDPDAPHMARARAAIMAAGGAARSNVFTRILLALFEQVPWHAVPVMPVQIMVLPSWFPFHLDKVSYWSRTVIVPLLVIMAKKPRPANPGALSIQELMVEPPEQVKNWHVHVDGTFWGRFFRRLDGVLRPVEPFFPRRQKSIRKAVEFVTERLNGEDGLGAIYPAMANSVMMFKCLGYPDDHPDLRIAWASIEKLVDTVDGVTYAQPCLSPVWDTALTAHALLESDEPEAVERAKRGLDWLVPRQVLDVKGDWAVRRPDVRPGGWAFQYNNAHYPDLDDTAVVVMAMHRADPARYREAIDRGVEWILGLQSSNGGWAAFEVDNTYHYLNHIPFADHGALLDPPTSGVTARCVSMLGQLGRRIDDPAVARAVEFLRREQEADGSWFGRWGTNYIYGTWSVLCALNAIEMDPQEPMIRRAVAWLVSQQREDGGWGESGDSYYEGKPEMTPATSTASQTAWAVLALMAAGEAKHPAVERGVAWLSAHQREDGLWDEPSFTAVGFPRVFYLRYHGYPAFFPTWALSRYRRLRDSNSGRVEVGM